jgi:hypothetical protein
MNSIAGPARNWKPRHQKSEELTAQFGSAEALCANIAARDFEGRDLLLDALDEREPRRKRR